jgi:hypothetical protein
MATTAMEKCANCDRVIGKLETPQVWQDQIVCAECYGRLSSTPVSNGHAPRTRISIADEIAAELGGDATKDTGTATRCPQCGSTDLVRAKAVYEQGSFSATTAGAGFTLDGDVGLYGGTTHTRSALAARLSPPVETERRYAVIIIGGVVAILLTLGAVAMLSNSRTVAAGVAAALGALVLVWAVLRQLRSNAQAEEYNKTLLPSLRVAWSKTWYCRKCSLAFKVQA